ncbi:FG-GAP repeat domain-containing protein [Ruegeria arenilitoris]|uniref:FG-GAP repeat domain-containing protein n=1 Tax=Ruegeria arenilitoris TaxID=1173585 RepID=UPI00147C2341|nr:VCBS repeat-containing protein [Ruegeria arenilitoris]
MISKAPRLPARLWQCRARGALLAMCLWLAGGVPAVAKTITSARFTEPTTRYAHGVLGDNVEYGALELTVQGGTLTIRLPSDRVFEDLAPRLADMDLDGKPEVIVVESHNRTGAQLAIYDSGGRKIAATPHIGTRFRWLAPIGAADLDSDGFVEIAYVDRPHLAKTLRIWRFKDGDLAEIATLPGLTNHKIGDDFITGGIRDCGTGPEMIVVSADWQQIVSIRHEKGWGTRTLSPFSRKAMKQVLTCTH